MFEKIGKKWAMFFGLLISILLLSLVFGLVGKVKDVQAVAGSYSIVFRAGDTDDYIPDIPYPGTGGITNTVPPVLVGRANGNAVGMDNDADYQGDPSLQPSDMARCQIVPYFFYITVNGVTTPENGSIVMRASWGTETTSGSEFGFNKDVMIYSAFVDYTDPATIEVTGTDATATLLDEYWVDSGGDPSPAPGDDVAFEAIFQVDGLDNGDEVVLEVWTVLDCAPTDGNPKVTGNIQVALEEAYTNPAPPGVPDTISTGNQTNPITSAGDFQPAPVNLNVYKYDNDVRMPLYKYVDGLYTPTWMNTIVVTAATEGDSLIDYVANEVVVVDTLDPWVMYMDSLTLSDDLGGLRTCTWVDDDTDGLGGTITCDLLQMAELDTITITYLVKAVSGVPIGSVCEGIHEVLPATSVATECLPTYLSPTGYDVMNRVDLTTVSGDLDLADNWDEEPKDIIYPTSVQIDGFTAIPKFKSAQLEWTAIDQTGIEGYNLWRATSEDGPRIKVNDEVVGFSPLGDYEFMDLGPKRGLLPNHTYFYWLEGVSTSGNEILAGPIEVTVTPFKYK